MIRLALILLLLPLSLAAQTPVAPIERMDNAFQIAQTVQNTQAARAVQQIALRVAAKAEGLEPLAIERRNLTEELARVQGDTRLDPDLLRTQLERLDTALLVNGQKLARGFPGYMQIVAPDPLTIAEAQGLMAPDEALLQMHQGRDWLTLWMITPRHVLWHRLPVTQGDAAELVQLFREGMGLDGALRAAAALDAPQAASARPFNNRLAAILHMWLFSPYDAFLAEYDHLMIVADKAWIGLPFSALLTDPVEGDMVMGTAELRMASWMARRHAITMLPSAVSLRTARQSAAQASQGGASTLLALGDPIFTGAEGPEGVVRAGGGGIDIADLAPLPGTRREVRAIAREFAPGQAQVLLGAQATETAIRQADLTDRDVIVFATHGLIAGELQGLAEPALALTPPLRPTALDDGLLTAGEVAGLTLNAEWVVLSACNTAAGDGAGAEGLSGLARSFFAAGARALLVSHWPVRDDAAARLTSLAFAEMRADPSLRKSEAMRRAMMALMADARDDTLAHPTAWAPFFVVGGG